MPFDGIELSETTKALIQGQREIMNGWCQGAGRKKNAVCTVVAISHVPDAVILLQRIINTPYVAQWNDDPKRTKDDVLKLYDKAISISIREFN